MLSPNNFADALSATPAETGMDIVWMDWCDDARAPEPAENGPFSRSFSASRCTGSRGEDCYTFERFASRPDVIHTAYYYHHKRTRIGLKEETKWS